MSIRVDIVQSLSEAEVVIAKLFNIVLSASSCICPSSISPCYSPCSSLFSLPRYARPALPLMLPLSVVPVPVALCELDP
ncbi:hypothetical protein BV20DRAFT_767168 [Pilatotrama ljubarskyi]|nr:hypothetical protein BV20DRAFT_767168 [Pilatotrama ljubarskyi]